MSDALDELLVQKQSVWRKLAAATLNNETDAATVCKQWSTFAEYALKTTFDKLVAELQIDVAVALFAFGKLGAEELNLSSDVDILLVAQAYSDKLTKLARGIASHLHHRSDGNFILRVDFDLRPGGKASPLVATVEQFVDYYGNFGETWERMAFVRLRQIAGSEQVGSEVFDFVKRYSYRRYLDYRLFDDLKILREKIQAYVANVDGAFNLKLSVGGIRDIELFVHAMQVIHGGRRPEIRTHSTDEALSRLQAAGLLKIQDVALLKKHYWQLRTLENYVQALNEQQTHLYYYSATHPPWVQTLWQELKARMPTMTQLIGVFIGSLAKPKTATETNPVSNPELEVFKQELINLPILSRHKESDLRLRQQFIDSFLPKLKIQSLDFEKSLAWVKDFLIATKAKGQIISLLIGQSQLQDHLAVCFAKSSFLSRTLINHPELLDSILLGSQEIQDQDLQLLLQQAAERKMLTEFVGGMDFLLNRDLIRLQSNLSACADLICEQILIFLNREFNTDLKILCLGKWGGQELGFSSDLDFIFVSNSAPGEIEQKVARRFLSYLQQTQTGAPIYSFDLRLKPQGAILIVDLTALTNHLQNSSSVWERQAYLKARWLGEDKPAALSQVYLQKSLNKSDLVELWRIQTGLFQNQKGNCDLKYSPGGMLDIELCLQTLALVSHSSPPGTSINSFFELLPIAQPLQPLYKEFSVAISYLRLMFESPVTNLNFENESALKGISPVDTDVVRYYEAQLKKSWEILKVIDPRRT